MIDKSSLLKSQVSLYLEFIPKYGLFHKMLLLSLIKFLLALPIKITNGNVKILEYLGQHSGIKIEITVEFNLNSAIKQSFRLDQSQDIVTVNAHVSS